MNKTFLQSKRLTLRSSAAYTLVEMLVVMAVVGILAALLLPTLGVAKRRANVAMCASNIRQIAMATIMYATGDPTIGLPYINGDWVCPGASDGGSSWGVGYRRTASHQTGFTNNIFWCPSDNRKHYKAVTQSPANWWYGSYGINACIGSRVRFGCLNGGRNNYFLSQIKNQSQIILIAEDIDDHTTVPTKYWPGPGWCTCSIFKGNGTRHDNKGNVAFCDGHVELLTEPQTLPPPDGTGVSDMWTPADGRACVF